MDYEVAWSPEALEDAEEIAAYIHKDSPHYASVVIEKLINASDTLTQFPHRGRTVPELELSDYREIFVYSYRLIYRTDKQSVLIVAVIHGSRLLEKAVADRIPANDV
ncbi:type II toxin-antitoxin system RelE/ParE family toxin [Beggiatoa alba]|nr:type II toxin-antitoxin system RelE/ParE family toxin [Beggiatoa alba]